MNPRQLLAKMDTITQLLEQAREKDLKAHRYLLLAAHARSQASALRRTAEKTQASIAEEFAAALKIADSAQKGEAS